MSKSICIMLSFYMNISFYMIFKVTVDLGSFYQLINLAIHNYMITFPISQVSFYNKIHVFSNELETD